MVKKNPINSKFGINITKQLDYIFEIAKFWFWVVWSNKGNLIELIHIHKLRSSYTKFNLSYNNL